MKKIFLIFLVLFSFASFGQVYQAMPQPGYGPVKRMLFDSVLTLPTSITSLRNITGGRDTGQIRYNKADSAIYVHTGYGWIKDNSGGTITSIATGLGLSGGTITSSGTLIVDTSSASILSRQRAAYTYAPISITGTVTSVTGTSPVVSSGGATPAISMPVATTSVNGYLSSANWTTFNAKESALTFSSPLSRSTNTISIPAATTSVNGYLSSTDWTTFNNKQATISATSPVVLTGAAISIPAATTSVNGYLTSANWTTFNNKQATITLTTTGTSGASTLVGATLNIPNYADAYVGTVTSVAALTLGTTGTDLSSTVATGTTTPVITLQVPTASATNRGALSSADWSTFNSKQSTITLTTTGTSGAATFSANTLNIPNYGSALSAYLPLTGGTLTGALNLTNVNINLSNSYSLTARNNANSAYISLIQRNTSDKVSIDADGYGTVLGGALSGTSATFSSSVTATSFAVGSTSNFNAMFYTGGANASYIQMANGSTGAGSANGMIVGVDASGNGIVSIRGVFDYITSVAGVERMRIASTGAATFSSTGAFGNATLNGAYLVVKGANGVPASSGTTTTAVFRVSSGTGLYNVLDFGTNEASDYSWIQSTRANSLGTYDYLAIQPNGGNLLVGTLTNSGYKLDVNGTGNFSGALTGTSATFSTASGNQILLVEATTGTNASYMAFKNTGQRMFVGIDNSTGTQIIGSGNPYQGVISMEGARDLVLATSGITRLTIASTGAATFSSSVTGQAASFTTGAFSGNLTCTGVGFANTGIKVGLSTTSGLSSKIQFTDAATYNWTVGGTGAGNFAISYGEYSTVVGTTALSIALTGAATFSSSVRLGNFTTTEINALTPAAGMVVFNTTLSVVCFYDGTAWKKVSHSAM